MIHNYIFSPWRVVGDRRVVAAESSWKLPVRWNRKATCDCLAAIDPAANATHRADCPQAHRPRVFCASLADVFEDWTGDMHLTNGDVAGVEVAGGGVMKLTMQDVRVRLFRLIDATPHLDWLIITKRPENIERMMPEYARGPASQRSSRAAQLLLRLND